MPRRIIQLSPKERGNLLLDYPKFENSYLAEKYNLKIGTVYSFANYNNVKKDKETISNTVSKYMTKNIFDTDVLNEYKKDFDIMTIKDLSIKYCVTIHVVKGWNRKFGLLKTNEQKARAISESRKGIKRGNYNLNPSKKQKETDNIYKYKLLFANKLGYNTLSYAYKKIGIEDFEKQFNKAIK